MIICFYILFVYDTWVFQTALLVLFPLLAIAEDKNAGDDALIKTQSMIDSRVFLENGGAEKMKSVSVNLDSDLKEMLYSQNQKYGAWGWLNLALPSLGNWIVGDKDGAVTTIVGHVTGLAVFTVGYGILISAVITENMDNLLVGYVIMMIYPAISLSFDIYSIASAYSTITTPG